MPSGVRSHETFPRIERYEADALRAGKQPSRAQYGRPEAADASGRARCRRCGERIAKGDRVIRFMCDFLGSGSWTAVQCYIHSRDC